MNSIIIDDDPNFCLLIEEFCKISKKINLIKNFSNAIEAISFLNENVVDVIFLDYNLPYISGEDFIKTTKNLPYIIMLTANSDFAVKAFRHEKIIDYILKPINYSLFLEVIGKTQQILASPSHHMSSNVNECSFYINFNGKMVKIEYDDILYLQANADYVNIKTKETKFIVHITLKEIKKKLPETFIQVHRSYIINKNKIIDIDSNSININNQIIPISNTYKKDFFEQIKII